jgi:NitT/TauT family transport system substrate-binding protein
MSDIGYNPYASLLVTTESYAKQHADTCRRMVQASIEGWQKYLSEPQQSNAVILAANKQGLTKEALDYGVEALTPLCYENGNAEGIGAMNPERWTQLADTLVDLKLIDRSKLNVSASYTTEFLARTKKEPSEK